MFCLKPEVSEHAQKFPLDGKFPTFYGDVMLGSTEIKKIREELEDCKNPLYFFHDDPDGLASFLMFYRHIKEGHGIPVKATPNVDTKFIRKIEEYRPDKIFILDLAMVSEDFLERAKEMGVRVVWIDHHEPQETDVLYFNPRVKDPKDTSPISSICYEVVKQNLWIAAVGVIGDWHWNSHIEEFKKKYPDLLPANIKKPEDALFKTKLGELVKIFSFILMGKMSEIKRYIKVMTRIKEPHEILQQKSSAGRFIYKKFEKINNEYQRLLRKAEKEIKEEDGILLFIYSNEKISFTKDLSNELLYKNRDKIIIIGREKTDEIKMSLRSEKHNLQRILESALLHIDGYGGGHEHACGACVKKHDFRRFIENLKREFK